MIKDLRRRITDYIAGFSSNFLPTLLIVTILAGVGGMYVYGPALVTSWSIHRLNYEAKGVIVKVEPQKTITENLMGGRVTVGGFLLTYRYTIAEKEYVREEYLPRNAITSSSYRRILRIAPGDTIRLKYSADRPGKARWSFR